MTVTRLAKHFLWRCGRDEPDCPGCILCEGGLAVCVVCGGGEAALPTDCPGEDMTSIQMNAVQAGALDYRRGRGWIRCDAIESGGVA